MTRVYRITTSGFDSYTVKDLLTAFVIDLDSDVVYFRAVIQDTVA